LKKIFANYLADNMTEVEIAPEQVFLSWYIDAALPLDTPTPYCTSNPCIDADFISNLYS
jgi:hypothetical protein